MATRFASIDDYIAAQRGAAREILDLLRRTVRGALPKSVEAISYNIPTCQIDGRPVLWFAGWKRHYSLYPASERLAAAFRAQLAPFEVQKGTIRFPLSAPVPVKLIEDIAKF